MTTLDHNVAVARAVGVLAAKLLPLWPALRLEEGVERTKPPAREKPDVAPHRWIFTSKFWRCEGCLKVSWSCGKPAEGNCRGLHKLDPQVFARLQHRCVSLECSDGATLVVCLKCKAYSGHGQVRNLAKECNKGPRTAGARAAWTAIASGDHPKFPGVTVQKGPWSQ